MQRNNVALAGEFAVLSQLIIRGFDATLTLGHTKNVDILVSDPESGQFFKIEAKTNYAAKPTKSKLFGYHLSWIVTKKHESIVDPKLYYCFVNIEKETNKFRFFIVPSRIVAETIRNHHQFWLEHAFFKKGGTKEEDEKNMIRNFIVGLEDDQTKYKIFTPLAKDYENNWNFS